MLSGQHHQSTPTQDTSSENIQGVGISINSTNGIRPGPPTQQRRSKSAKELYGWLASRRRDPPGRRHPRIMPKSVFWEDRHNDHVILSAEGLSSNRSLTEPWTIMSSTWNHLQAQREGRDDDLIPLADFTVSFVLYALRSAAAQSTNCTNVVLQLIQSLPL